MVSKRVKIYRRKKRKGLQLRKGIQVIVVRSVKMPKTRKRGKKISSQNQERTVAKISAESSVWCHLCKESVSDHAAFRLHIMKRHRPTSECYEGSDDGSDISDNKNYLNFSDCIKMDSSENESDVFAEAEEACNKHMYNISESAVTPQSSTYLKEKSLKSSNSNFSSINCNKSVEVNDLATINSVPTNDISTQFSPIMANQISTKLNTNTSHLTSTPNTNPNFNPQFILNNNQMSVVPYVQQQLGNQYHCGMPYIVQSLGNGYFLGSQPVIYYMPEFNSVVKPTEDLGFQFNAKNIISWYEKFKKMYRQIISPMSPRLLKKVRIVHKAISENCRLLSNYPDEDRISVMKVYQELDAIFAYHLKNVNDSL